MPTRLPRHWKFSGHFESACLACSAGFFSEVVAALAPRAYDAPGLSNQTAYCLPCQPGTSAPEDGAVSTLPNKHKAASLQSGGTYVVLVSSLEALIVAACSAFQIFKVSGRGPVLLFKKDFQITRRVQTSKLRGTYTVGNGSVSCLKCRPGRYKNMSQTRACSNCPRGFITDVEGATACKRCPLASYTTEEGKSACTVCDAGRYGKLEGICSVCPRGTFQDEKKMTECKLCPKDRYNTEFGATAKAQCMPCAIDRTTGNITGSSNISACLCKELEFYQEEEKMSAVASEQLAECTPCPVGARCPIPGSHLADMYAIPHFWQPENLTADFVDCASAFSDRTLAKLAQKRCCPLSANCHRVPRPSNWTTDDQCALGYAGPLCTLARRFAHLAMRHPPRRRLSALALLGGCGICALCIFFRLAQAHYKARRAT